RGTGRDPRRVHRRGSGTRRAGGGRARPGARRPGAAHGGPGGVQAAAGGTGYQDIDQGLRPGPAAAYHQPVPRNRPPRAGNGPQRERRYCCDIFHSALTRARFRWDHRGTRPGTARRGLEEPEETSMSQSEVPSLYGGPATRRVRTRGGFLKEGGGHAVKLEGGRRVAPQIAAMTAAGIPVMAHVGFTPQSEHVLGGYRVQGRGDAAEDVVADAHAVAEAGAFAVVLEMVPGEVAKRVTHDLAIPTIGIGAGPDCDAQVLVWQDLAGLRTGKAPRFVKRYADLAGVLTDAVQRFATEVRDGEFPAGEHTF